MEKNVDSTLHNLSIVQIYFKTQYDRQKVSLKKKKAKHSKLV